MKKFVLKNNVEHKRYEFEMEGPKPLIEYIKSNRGVVYLTHIEVPSRLQRRGVGQLLVKETLEDVERQGLTVMPSCPFVAAYMVHHPETHKLLMSGVKIV